MNRQLSIFDDIITRGATYVCEKPWVNEMGYKWKPGEKVIIEKVHDISALVRIPNQKQHFEILTYYLLNNFSIHGEASN